MRLSTSRGHATAISRFLQEIYTLQDTLSLYGVIRDGLGGLVSGDNVFIGEHDMEHTQVTGCVVRHLFETRDFLTIVNGCASEHPLWEPIRTGDQVVRALSDHASAATWENTRLYREALGPEGVRDHLSIEFGERHKRIISVGIFRSRRGFTTQERETLQGLIPHLGLALDNARRVESMISTSADETFSIPLTPDRDICAEGIHLLPALAAACGEPEIHPRRLPPRLQSWLDETCAHLQRGALDTLMRPLRLDGPSGTLELRILRRRFDAGFILHGRHVRRSPTYPLQPLTKRERDVLTWVREGKTNAEIATILDLKPTTIKTHLKHIFEKLGVENRTAAARHVT